MIISNIKFFVEMNLWRLITLLVIFISSCNGKTKKLEIDKLYKEDSVAIHANRFAIDQMDGYKKLTIMNPWQGARNINQVSCLVKRGSEIPDGLDSSMVIFVPLRSIICMSTTHLAMISALGEENSISGVSGSGYIYSNKLINRVEKGFIKDVGFEASLNKELIFQIDPDLIMMYGIGSESNGYVTKLKELGVKVIYNADYLETDPLSKVEWIKIFGALYCKEDMADSIYNSEVESYNNLKTIVANNILKRPKVLLGLPFKDTWYISPGNSFISKLIDDAGGEYLWRNVESSISMPYGIENVFIHGLDAEFWLNIGTAITKDDISMLDQRLMNLPCFLNGNMFNNNNRITENGGNDYWESGSVYPHIILRDIASILHPDLFKQDQLFFYRKIN
jgi:cobalamin transport system substrate-binding protein